jgi:hypothetical protein
MLSIAFPATQTERPKEILYQVCDKSFKKNNENIFCVLFVLALIQPSITFIRLTHQTIRDFLNLPS